MDDDEASLTPILEELRKGEMLLLGGFELHKLDDSSFHKLCLTLATNTKVLYLDLFGHNITFQGVKSLCTIFETNTTINVLNLNCVTVNDDGAELLGDMLATNDSLDKLLLFRANIFQRGVEALCRGLATNTSLTTLTLYDNHLGDGSAPAISHLISTNTTLCDLSLGKNGITSEGVKIILEGLTLNPFLRVRGLSSDYPIAKTLKNRNKKNKRQCLVTLFYLMCQKVYSQRNAKRPFHEITQ